MIIYPKEWNKVGDEITVKDADKALSKVIEGINCDCLAYSGGIDSTILLYHILRVHGSVRAFTMGSSLDHPDVKYAQIGADKLGVDHYVNIPSSQEITQIKREDDFDGDEAVRLFYEWASKYTDNIISGDGIDEFMCGYYPHQNNPTEETYIDYIRRMQCDQLEPLNKNSGVVKLYLPYLANELIGLWVQIPLSQKVDNMNRKIFMCEWARYLEIPEEIITRRKFGFCSCLKEIEYAC